MESLIALGSTAGTLLKERKQTLAVAESSAGGLINAALVAVPGASAYYLGGAIVYTLASRSGLLGLTAHDMTNIRSASAAGAARARETGGDLGSERDGCERADRQPLWRRGWARVHRCVRSSRGRHHSGDGECGPGGQHVGVCTPRD